MNRIGGYERGIQWSWESLRGWQLEKPKEAMRFIPSDDEYVVEFTLVDHPITVAEPFTIELGLHALPAKPFPEKGIRGPWWAWAGHKDLGVNWYEWPSPGGRKVEIGSHQPRLGGMDNCFNLPQEVVKSKKERFKRLNERLEDGYQWGPHLFHYRTGMRPEVDYYYEDWRNVPAARSADAAQVCYGSDSYQNYYVYYFHKFWKEFHEPEGLPFAIYYDVSRPMSCANLTHGCGYVDEQGKRHTELPILAWRETTKRLYTIMKSMGHDNWMTTHMSGHPGMAYWAFNDVMIPGEQWAAYMRMKKAEYEAAGKEWPLDYTRTLPLDRYRAEFSPWIWGPQTAFLSQSYAWLDPGDEFNDRHWCAINLVHDAFPYGGSITNIKLFPVLREFGWDDKVECLPYWRNQKYVSLDIYDQDHFVATLWRREGKLMVLVFNNWDEDRTTTLTLHADALGIEAAGTGELVDVETEEVFPLEDGKTRFQVEQRNFRMLRLQKR
jgi:hypothetical protein